MPRILVVCGTQRIACENGVGEDGKGIGRAYFVAWDVVGGCGVDWVDEDGIVCLCYVEIDLQGS